MAVLSRAGRARRHLAWMVAAVTFVTLLGASGIGSAPGVLIVPLEEEFGWSRATISAAVSVNLVLSGPAGPFAAAAMARFGLLCVVAALITQVVRRPAALATW